MLQKLKHYAGVTRAFYKISVLQTLEYRAGIMGWLLANPIQFIVGFATIKFVVEEFGTIAGWEYGHLAFLYGISAMTHALNVIFFYPSWEMGWYVNEGEFDRYMLRPLNILFQFYFAGFNAVGFTDMIPGICVFLYGCIQINFEWSFRNVILILITLIGATLIRGGLYLILGSTTFWTKSVASYSGYTQELFDKTTMYPLSIYPEALQFILTYLLPIGWVSFYPVSELIGMPNGRFAWDGAVYATLIIGIVVFVIASRVFKMGLKRYESAGN